MSKSKRDCLTLQTIAGCSGKPMVGQSVGERTMRERVRLHGDGKIGLPEVIYIMQKAAGVR